MERELAVLCAEFDLEFQRYNSLIKEEEEIHERLATKAEQLKALKWFIDDLRAKICN